MRLIKTLASEKATETTMDFISFHEVMKIKRGRERECFKMEFVIETSHIYYVFTARPQQFFRQKKRQNFPINYFLFDKAFAPTHNFVIFYCLKMAEIMMMKKLFFVIVVICKCR
jgi:hypothetical protein